MAVEQKFIWLSGNFVVAVVCACLFQVSLFQVGLFQVGLFQVSDARAQSRIDTSISSPAIPPLDARRAPVIRTRQAPITDENAIRTPVPVPQRDVRFEDSETERDETAADRRRVTRRRVPLDGDLRPVAVPVPLDGTITVGEPGGVQDGGDPTREEGRAPEDIAAFESPPAGFDPAAFAIEVAPILDRRPRQLFRFQPFQPIGHRLGSFVVFGELETGFSATNNVFRTADARSDVAVDVAPSLRVVSNWRRHAVELNASGLASFYNEFSTENDRIYQLEARGRMDITRRSNIAALVSRDVAQESRGSANSLSVVGQTRANITTDTAAVTANHRFNRLSLQMRGSIVKIDYDPTQVDIAVAPAAPVFVSVDDRDYNTREVAARASWEFNPELTVFGEVAVNDRNYDMLQGGVDRNSTGQRFRAGVSFGNGGEYLRGEVSLGYGLQDPRSANLRSIDGLLFDANLAWRFSELTSLLLTAGSDITETTIAGSSGGFTRTAGISLRHAFRRNFIATAGINYFTVNYEGVSLTENTLSASLGAEYVLNRYLVLFGDYDHIKFDSSAPGRDYNVDEVRVGVRVRK